MSLHIDNEETHRLAKRLAKMTGQTITAAVTQALQERLRQIRRKGMAERLLRIGKECAPLFKEPYKSVDHGELLYDEKGLPK